MPRANALKGNMTGARGRKYSAGMFRFAGGKGVFYG